MKKLFKQLFCSHIYKDIYEEFLTERKNWNVLLSVYITYNVYAVTQECVKCDKNITKEVERVT